ncbi:MAG: 50S ribosomal protein L22 [Deltaproteobacteria bacterium GWA2_38_16]|nr:MAG: 50S ribosomal protein L22 [Deltaproteobacteria bacterium GWA2_38_16]OGQ03788.1 MAG: 50S ribosomal protein L22 [Deltaproteobacteria bacterium RIFCSPHIGHO2_02_FULL_38_15]OGQ59136.1 MAG: 50S ribosomal protein L22 [Deltaproteobacteria bacterium RIFCSPLOWO2_12_FULL_38_8]HBQ20827.1 50S ribosomal protein L22 [Deltaproteobacteria bacterium]
MAGSRAHLSYTFIGPQKLKLVTDLVKGKNVQHALNILKFTPKKGAQIVSKVIRSAVSNADQKGKIDVDNLYVKHIQVGQGMMHYRVHARARGSAAWIRKKTSHLTVELEER